MMSLNDIKDVATIVGGVIALATLIKSVLEYTKQGAQDRAEQFETLRVASQSPEMQLVELREYAARRGWHVVEEYVDHGVSGAKESRPALNRLMTDAKQRRFDVVAVWKIDRFGRSLKHLVNALAEFFLIKRVDNEDCEIHEQRSLSVTPTSRYRHQITAV